MGRRLLPHHTEDLRRSGLGDEIIDALGFYSGTAAEIKGILGFDAGPGLVIPYPTYEGQEPFSRVKPDNPPIINGGPAKYLSPKGAQVRAYIPQRTWEALKGSKTPIIITEGEKKAAKAAQEGFPCIGLGGVWGFSQKHTLIPGLVNLKWDGRDVFLAPDSDHQSNRDVKLAVFTLERWLTELGASVSVLRFPPSAGGSKSGLDDFLVANGPDALRQLLGEARPSLFWEIEDVAGLPEHRRLKPLMALFKKLARLDGVEISPFRNLCKERLGISLSDFRAQRKTAQHEKQSKEMQVVAYAAQQQEAKAEQEAEQAMAKLSPKTLELLRDPALLYRVGAVAHQLGVAGEDENIRLLYLAITSRMLENPISITLKGESSSGKSYLTEKVCLLFPPSAYIAMTGMTRQALVYTDESYAHRTVIVFERPGMEAADYNIRTLQSEGRVVFETVVRDPETNQHYTKRIEKEGPTNFIFTTTAPELQPENETRHWSLLMDESQAQTAATKVESAKRYEGQGGFSGEKLAVWRQIQNELKPLRVGIPYARWLAEHTPDRPLRMRRDFNRVLALIEVVAIVHQQQRRTAEGDTLVAGLADYFMAKELMNQVFPASLAGINKKVEALVSEVGRLHQEKLISGELDPVVKPPEIALALHISPSSVSRWLRPAVEAGLVEPVSETAKGRIRSVRPGLGEKQAASALPSLEELADAFPELSQDFHVVHPLTGEEFALREQVEADEKNSQLVL